MSATANPHFELQQQALNSIKRIQNVCLLLQGLQAAGSVLVLSLGYWMRPFHLYGAMIYLFSAVFAHIVVYYVFMTIGQNVRDAHASNPARPNEWLVYATGRMSGKIFPFIFLHSALLFSCVGIAAARVLQGRAIPHLHVASWCVAAVGLGCLVRVALALRETNGYLTSFVRGGGFTAAASRELIEH